MKALSIAWSVFKSRPFLFIAALGAGLVLAGECRSFREDARQAAAPVTAAPTRSEKRAEVLTLPCETVQVLELKPKDLERVAERYKRPELVAETDESQQEPKILAEREVPRWPAGGTALVTLEPDGRTEVTLAPNPEPLFDLRSTYEIGALAGVGTAGDTRARAWAAIEPMRWGRIHLRAEAGVDIRGGSSDAYVMAGAVWRSR